MVATTRTHKASALKEERDALLRNYAALVEPLQQTLPGNAEVALHDLSKLPDSIVAIAGNLTGRSVGSPATDWLLRASVNGALETQVAYESRMPGGREMRSTTIMIRTSDDTPIAALCINCDVTMWRAVSVLAESMLPRSPIAVQPDDDVEEFAHDIDELANHLLRQAIAASDAPVELMQKRHKIAVVQDLKRRGFFTLKESVETAAQALGVTRFTIYNYLNELDELEDAQKS